MNLTNTDSRMDAIDGGTLVPAGGYCTAPDT